MEQLVKKAENLARQKKFQKAFQLLKEADSNGIPMASYALGTWYLNGRHVKKDLHKGFQYLIKASKGQIKEAFFDLAVCYEKGAGTEKNPQKAFQYYLAASELGDKESLYEIVRCLYYGIGVEKNKNLSTLIYNRVFNLPKPAKIKKPQIKKLPRLEYA